MIVSELFELFKLEQLAPTLLPLTYPVLGEIWFAVRRNMTCETVVPERRAWCACRAFNSNAGSAVRDVSWKSRE